MNRSTRREQRMRDGRWIDDFSLFVPPSVPFVFPLNCTLPFLLRPTHYLYLRFSFIVPFDRRFLFLLLPPPRDFSPPFLMICSRPSSRLASPPRLRSAVNQPFNRFLIAVAAATSNLARYRRGGVYIITKME